MRQNNCPSDFILITPAMINLSRPVIYDVTDRQVASLTWTGSVGQSSGAG